MNNSYFNILLIIFVLLWGLFSSGKAQLTVAVAANVKFPMEELKAEFTNETGIEVTTVIGSSGKLTAQIQQGAPFDVFISADMKYPNYLYKQNLSSNPPKVYALGKLVLWTLKDDIDLQNFPEVFRNYDVKLIAVPNPKTAPYGKVSVEVLKKINIYEKIKDKLIFGENVSSTSQYIFSKHADIGFTAKSVVLSKEMNGKGKWIDVDPKIYNPIEQGCVILKYGEEKHYKESKKFYNFLFSLKARKIFSRYGFETAGLTGKSTIK